MDLELADIAQYMRMGRTVPEGALAERIAALRSDAASEIRVARTWRRMPVPPHWIAASKALSLRLSGCRDVYLVCGTLGAAFDAFQRRVSVMSGADALIVQAVGAAAIEKVMDSIEAEIRTELPQGETLVPRYSPGYGDFPLAAQRELLELLDASRTIGVSLTDSLLMVPSKSVSAVVGVRG